MRRAVRDAVRSGERSEVVIEGAVLLHDEDEVVDVEDAELRIDPAAERGAPVRPATHADGSAASAVASNAHDTTPSMSIRRGESCLMEAPMVAGRPRPGAPVGSMAAETKEVAP